MNWSHFYWSHFWWGLAIGAGLSTWILWGMLPSVLGLILVAGIALFIGFCSGKWGDEFWREWLSGGP